MSNRRIPDRPPPQDTLLSVVLPVYNEAGVLPLLVERIAAAVAECGADYEIIFVDDGSEDDSPRVLDELAAANRRVRVIHLSRNFGHQAAIQAGMAHSRGDAVVLMDSDMQDAPQAIPRFVEQWRAGFDVVYAVHIRRKEGRLKRSLFAAFHRLLSRVAAVQIPIDTGNFGLVDRRVAGQIAAMRESDRYFPGFRCWVGFHQTGIEVERDARYDDRPRVPIWQLFRLAKTAVFSFSRFPLLIFHVIGLAATVVFVCLSCFALYCKLVTGQAIPGWTSHMLTGSFFGALNALGICILGEYVIRIYDQVRGRPPYLVDRTVNLRSDAEAPGQPDTEPCIELMEQAVRLLEAATIQDEPRLPAESANGLSEPVLFSHKP